MGRTTTKGEAFWAAHVEQYRRGGVSLREYCECQGLKLSTFGRWRRRLCREGAGTTVRPPVPVKVVRVDVEPQAAPHAVPLEVVLGNGRCIRVGSDFDAATLVRVVTTLERLSWSRRQGGCTCVWGRPTCAEDSTVWLGSCSR